MRRNRNDDHAGYDVSVSKSLKNIARVLGAVMKPEAHAHAFCSALQFSVCYKPIASGNREERAGGRKNAKESESEIK